MPRKNNTPKHQPFRLVNNCEQKRRFKSEKEALDAADYQMLLNPSLELSVYKCEQCGNCHLTSGQSRSRYTQA